MEEKIVRLTNTVYKILEYFPESDPLKKRIKDKALSIMSAFGEKNNQSIVEDIDILLGFLQIGRSQKWISPSNFLIIVNEYEKIKKDIKNFPLKNCYSENTQIKSKSILIDEKTQKRDQFSSLNSRQKKIIEFINKKEKAQVSDLQAILNNVTKRTIRRDLDELLKKGEILRFGEFSRIFYQINKDRTGRTNI